MSEISIDHSTFRPREAYPKERTSLRDRIGNLKRHVVTKIFRRPEGEMQMPKAAGKEKLPLQVVDEKSLYEAMKKVNPERAKRVYREGCAMRSLMSATAHATGEQNVRATDDEWKVWFQHFDAYDKALKAYNEGLKIGEVRELKDLYQHLRDVYEGFTANPTPLGRAIDNVDITIGMWETAEQIKNRIQKKEQVMVHIDTFDTVKSHLVHVGLDENDNFIALSDQKRKIIGMKPKYQKVNLSKERHNIFSVVPRDASPLPSDANHN